MRRAWGLALACALAVAACAPSAPLGQQVDTEGEIRVAADEDQWPVQGEREASKLFSYPLNVNVFEPLIYLASDYLLKPGLAEKWELVPPNTWRFHIRRGVKFHDGKLLTADDVVWTWGPDRQLKGRALTTVSNTLGLESVKKVDDYTVDITPKVPNLRLAEQIVHPNGAIMPKGKHPDEPGAVGTGPFKVVEYQKLQTVVLERFEDYWGEKPKVKRLVVRFLPDPQTRIQALRAGDVDFVVNLPPDAVRAMESAGFSVVKSPPGRNQLIYLYRNGKAPRDILGDRTVRQAISLAIDRKAYVDTVFDGNAAPGHAMAPPSVLGRFVELVPQPAYDPAKAKLLDQAGWVPGADGVRQKAGRALRLELIAWPEVSSTALEFLQAQLRAVGLDVVIKKAPDTPTYNGYYRENKFDLDLEVPNQNDGNPAFLPVLRMYSKNPGTERFAPGGAFDTWAEKALASQTLEGAQEASAQMMRILIHEDFTVVPLAGVFRIYAMRKGVKLADPHPSQTNQTWFSLSVVK